MEEENNVDDVQDVVDDAPVDEQPDAVEDNADDAPDDQDEQTEETSIFGDALREITESSGEEESIEESEEEPTEETADIGDKPPAENVAEKPVDVEKEILSEVKSQRARDRIKQMVSEHNKFKQEADGIRQQNEQFANIIRNTGMDPNEFAKTLEFCRLSRSSSEADMQVALELLEAERESIYARMGKVAPGSDPYKGYDNIRDAVDSFEAPEWMAADYARLKRIEDQQKAGIAQQQESLRQQQDMKNRLNSFVRSAMQQFSELQRTDPNFKAKERVVTQYLQQPGVMQNIVQNLPPEQWGFYMRSIYDSAQVSAPARRTSPISSRSTRLRSPQVSGSTAGDIFASALRNTLGG